jgi:hypothetical protein
MDKINVRTIPSSKLGVIQKPVLMMNSKGWKALQKEYDNNQEDGKPLYQ